MWQSIIVGGSTLAGVLIGSSLTFLRDHVQYERDQRRERTAAQAQKAAEIRGLLEGQVADGIEVVIKQQGLHLAELDDTWLRGHILRYKQLLARLPDEAVKELLKAHDIRVSRVYRVGRQREAYLLNSDQQRRADDLFGTLPEWVEELVDLENQLLAIAHLPSD